MYLLGIVSNPEYLFILSIILKDLKNALKLLLIELIEF